MEQKRGILNYNDIEYPFFYENGILYLLPQNREIWKKDRRQALLSLNSNRNQEKDEFIKHTCLVGKTNRDKDISFEVSEDCSSDNGFLYFNVLTIYEYQAMNREYEEDESGKTIVKEKENKIIALQLTGQVIDSLFKPNRVFGSELKFSDDGNRITDIAVSIEDPSPVECGTVSFKNVDVHIYVKATGSYRMYSALPLTSKSILTCRFSEEVDIELVEEFLHYLQQCFCYLCRRKNVQLGEISVLSSIENNRLHNFGKFAILNNHKEEDHVQANERVISIDNLGLSFSTLLSWFIADKMSISHLPAEIAEVNTLGLDRIIFDFVAFEKTYSHLYPEKEERSEDYLIIKTRVIEKIEEIKASASGRYQKEAAKSLKNAVEKSDNALHIRIKRAIERHKEILDPFLFHEYGKEYEAALECICKRMGSLRNNIAHGNFGLVIKPENHTDLHILEIILYVMRLNKLGLDKKTIQNSILDLFKLNMYIPDENDVCDFPEEQESVYVQNNM